MQPKLIAILLAFCISYKGFSQDIVKLKVIDLEVRVLENEKWSAWSNLGFRDSLLTMNFKDNVLTWQKKAEYNQELKSYEMIDSRVNDIYSDFDLSIMELNLKNSDSEGVTTYRIFLMDGGLCHSYRLIIGADNIQLRYLLVPSE